MVLSATDRLILCCRIFSSICVSVYEKSLTVRLLIIWTNKFTVVPAVDEDEEGDDDGPLFPLIRRLLVLAAIEGAPPVVARDDVPVVTAICVTMRRGANWYAEMQPATISIITIRMAIV